MPSGFHTSFPRSSMSGGRSAALFQTRVLPVCKRCLQLPTTALPTNCRLHANGRGKSLRTLVKKNENVLPWPQTTLHVRQRGLQGEQRHQRIPLFAAFCLVDLMLHIARGSDVGHSNEWQETSEDWDTVQLFHHGAAEHMVARANAAACASASIINLTTCLTQSVPTLIDNANWNGEQTDSTVFPNCLAKVFAINLRKLVPVAEPSSSP